MSNDKLSLYYPNIQDLIALKEIKIVKTMELYMKHED